MSQIDMSQFKVLNTADIDSVNLDSELEWESPWITLSSGAISNYQTPFKKISSVSIVAVSAAATPGVPSAALGYFGSWAEGAAAGQVNLVLYKSNTTAVAIGTTEQVKIVVRGKFAEQI